MCVCVGVGVGVVDVVVVVVVVVCWLVGWFFLSNLLCLRSYRII